MTTTREITHNRPTKIECDTETGSRFIYAFDYKNGWLIERQQLGQIPNRGHDKRIFKQELRCSSGPGHPSIVSDSQLEEMVYSPSKTRRRGLRTQLELHGIRCSRETVRRALVKRKRAGMFKAAKQKEITLPQQTQKLIYGFWDGVMFTGEAHMALDDFPNDWILRIIGERFKPENIFEEAKKSANDDICSW